MRGVCWPETGAHAPFDLVYESQQMTKALELHFLYDSKRSKTRVLKAYIELSETNPAYFDALHRISDILVAGNKDFPDLLSKWRAEICVRSQVLSRPEAIVGPSAARFGKVLA